MPLSKMHKEATRQKIIKAAAQLFREKGYDGIGIAGIMAKAGLTRGGFYAHFWSKGALFREVLRFESGLVEQLCASSDDASVEDVLLNYLRPNNLVQVHQSCNLAALTGDVSKKEAITRQTYTNLFKKLLGRLNTSGHGEKRHDDFVCAVLAVGGVMLAGALSDKQLASQLLESCRTEISSKLAG
ncbi:MAG: TetR/AcrR family transcriptional regulator [Pseudomonadales bacterium]|nr:TetR/AcrR family transcriptional regulator [Pseudomonadales bacterium]